MSLTELEAKVQSLSPEELHAFTQWLAAYTAGRASHGSQEGAIREGVGRMEDVIKGQAAGLTESQFREMLFQ